MAEQRQPFRFRLPWLSAPTAPTPPPRPSIESQPPRPPVETQRPPQPTMISPLLRPAFRPPGIAPAPPPPSQPRPPQKTEPQPPSNASSETQAAVQPTASTTSPSAAASTSPSRVASQPASPSRTATQTRAAASLPPSPSRAAPQSRPASVPSSPSPTSQQPWSPSFSSRPAAQTTSQPPSSPTPTATQLQPTGTTKFQTISASEQEPKPVVSQPLSQEPQPKAQVSSETMETSSHPDGAATQPTKVSLTSAVATETIAPPQKFDSNAIAGDAKPLAERKSEESGGKKVVGEIIEEEKKSGPAYEEPKKSTITELLTAAASATGAQTKDLLSVAFPAKEKQKEEAFDKKEAVVITSSHAKKRIDTASSTHSKDRKTSAQKPGVISSEERQLPLHEEVRKDISKIVQKLATGHRTAENQVSVVTLTGENRGASMHLGAGSESAKKERSVHIHRGYKLNPDESAEATTDGEGSSKAKKSKDSTNKQNPPSRVYINSNIQSVNNSMLLNSCVSERNPGVDLVVSNYQEEPIKSNGKSEPLEARKAEFNVTPAEKLTYEPTVRRRCLRGLFMEPSDSEPDPDNPEKPRRHGCRFNCAMKDKDKEIGID